MEKISPKYQMDLIKKIHDAIYEEYKTSEDVRYYIDKWHEVEEDWNNSYENFMIFQIDNKINLMPTLHGIGGEILLKIAIDLGVETPDFISSVPTFRNEIKSSYPTASSTFEKAFKQIEDHPDIAIGLVNSALESIIKEISKDDRLNITLKGSETLSALVTAILKSLQLFPDSNMPIEIKTIGSSLLSICDGIEGLRSKKTNFHGKTSDDYIISDPVYTYFIVNSATTVGLFLKNYYEKNFHQKKFIRMMKLMIFHSNFYIKSLVCNLCASKTKSDYRKFHNRFIICVGAR